MSAIPSVGQPHEFGRQWQGQLVDGRLPLDQYLGGSEQHAVFLTQAGTRKAAIRLMRAGSWTDAQLACWHRATQLSHPNLIAAVECGKCRLAGNDLLYLVTEYAEENLGQVLPHRPLTVAECHGMLRPTLDVLGYLHGQSLVHASLRPSNIMAIGERVKISSDSVQAEAVTAAKAGRAAIGTTLGRSVYDAPELAAGQLTPASDVWSLGLTLVQALTRNLPRDPKSGGEYTSLPQPFAEIARYCLQENPSSRWTVAQISDCLEGRTARMAGERKAVSASTPAPRIAPRRPRLFLLAAIVILAAILAVLSLVRRHSTRTEMALPNASSSQVVQSSPLADANVTTSTSGSVLTRVMPNPSKNALNTISGHIKVRIELSADNGGNVTRAKFLAAGPSHYFAQMAMQAAERWKFVPPAQHGQQFASQWILVFEFSKGGTQVFPRFVGPTVESGAQSGGQA